MRVLLDTNLVIAREQRPNSPELYPRLLGLLAEHSVDLLIHPVTELELRRDRDGQRRGETLWKLDSYARLENPPIAPQEFRQRSGERASVHDHHDTELLYAVQADLVRFLLTQDEGLIARAARVGLEDRVLDVNSALVYFSEHYHVGLPALPQYVKHGALNGAWISDPFFDSFRAEYTPFDRWFREKAGEGRRCVWAEDLEGRIGAMMIYKDEDEALPGLPRTRRLKLCSFKVGEKLRGFRLGEMLLSWGFAFMLRNRIEESYVDVLPSHPELKSMFEIFGFRHHSTTDLGEARLVKRTTASTASPEPGTFTRAREIYPRFDDGPEIRKFLIPVQPRWHSLLFPDYRARPNQHTLDEWGGATSDTLRLHPASNAIRKAYICNSASQQLRPGDITLFYRSRDVHRVTDLGVVERVERRSGVSEVADLVGNRTVLRRSELERFCSDESLVLFFWRVEGVLNRWGTAGLALDELGDAARAPQSISRIDDDVYRRICPTEVAE